AVLPGSPAEKIGLRPGDSILRIRGQDVAFMMSRAEVDVLLAGADGEVVDLVVQRRGDPGPTAQRLVLSGQPLPVVSSELVEHAGRKYAHVRIRAFRAGVADSVRGQLKEL